MPAPRAEPGGALGRVVRLYAGARAAIGVALVVALGATRSTLDHADTLAATLCFSYAALALLFWLLPRFRALAAPASDVEATDRAARMRRWAATIGIDLVFFGALHAVDRTSGFNFAALLVLPVLMAGVLMPRLLALGVAAAASLLLLTVALSAGRGEDPTLALTRAGLGGLGYFLIGILASELAARVLRGEATTRESLELARRQAQLNRLVIQEMSDGVLVVDRGLRVRAANPSARALLVPRGLGPPAPFDLRSRIAWVELARAVEVGLTQGQWPETGAEVALVFDDGDRRAVRLRMRFTRPSAGDEDGSELPPDPYAVLLLEDARSAQARLRQERLAAMGRVSAGVAHEIRNPLAAISQANELLREEALPPDQQRLAQIVADNVRRLQRLVDEVMELAPGHAPSSPTVIDARDVVASAAADWARTAGIAIGSGGCLQAALPEQPVGARFDAEHLRRILVNLLDNALRHSSAAPGSIALRMSATGSERVLIEVLSDGEPIAPEVERHLFEPFFSTRSRGSGLGLYICRELCERHGASIDYRLRPAHERLRNAFVILLRRAPLAVAPDAVLPLTP